MSDASVTSSAAISFSAFSFLFAWAVNIPLIIALIFTPTLVGKWKGMYKLNLRGYVLAVIGRALVVIAGYMGSVPLMMAFTALAALGQGPWQGDMNAVIASCSEYTYLTQGKRIDGSQRYMNCIISSADCG